MGNYLTDYKIQLEYLNIQNRLDMLEKQNKKVEQKYKNMLYNLEKKELLDNKFSEYDRKIAELEIKIERLYDYVEKIMKKYYDEKK